MSLADHLGVALMVVKYLSMRCCLWLHEAVSQGLNVAVLTQKADCGYQPLLNVPTFLTHTFKGDTYNVATLEADVSHAPGVLTASISPVFYDLGTSTMLYAYWL